VQQILLNVNVFTSFTLFSYVLCICACGLVEKTANSKKNGEISQNCGKYRVNIIMDYKTLQYFHVPIAYQIHLIIKKCVGEGCGYLSINIQTWLEYALAKRFEGI